VRGLSVVVRRIGAPVRGVGAARRPLDTREGLWLQLSDGARTGHGEASPLPGFSADRFADAAAALSGLDGAMLGGWLDGDVATLLAKSERIWSSPAARCAVETALLDLLGQRLGRSFPSLLRSDAHFAAGPVAALVAVDEPARFARTARQAVTDGATALKVKIGRPGAFASELAALHALRDACGDIELRLDANRAFPDAVAATRLAQLAAVHPRFVEEPFAGGLIGRRLDTEAVPIAVDESLIGSDDDAIGALLAAGPAAVIVKPMALGLGTALRLARQASAVGLCTIVTHLWDGPIALRMAHALSATVPPPTGAPGLATHPGLAAWPAMRFSDAAAGLGLESW